MRIAELSLNEFRVIASQDEVDAAAAHFATHHWLKLSGFLAPDLLRTVLDLIDRGSFEQRDDIHNDLLLAREETLMTGAAPHVLELVVNDDRLFQFVEKVARGGVPGCFKGRIYRFWPERGNFDEW